MADRKSFAKAAASSWARLCGGVPSNAAQVSCPAAQQLVLPGPTHIAVNSEKSDAFSKTTLAKVVTTHTAAPGNDRSVQWTSKTNQTVGLLLQTSPATIAQ
jgi:hypothetical protein